METDFHARRRSLSHHPFHCFEYQWLTEFDSPIWRWNNVSGFRYRNEERWDCQEKTDNGSRNSNFQKGRAIMKRRSNSDECAHCSDERRKRNEIGKTGIDSIVPACEVMPHLMTKQDGHDSQAEWQTAQKYRW